MPFKRAVVLLYGFPWRGRQGRDVSMPFKRAVVLLALPITSCESKLRFQFPLSGQLCCWCSWCS